MIYFPYFTEVFILLQILGWTHAGWWWVIYFALVDSATVYSYKKYEKVKDFS